MDEKEIAYRRGYIAACTWVLDNKPSKAEIRETMKYQKMMIAEE